MRTLIALVVTLAAAQADAGTLYKCVGPDGITVYQQTACAGAQQDAGIRAYQREPDAPQTGWAGQQQFADDQAVRRDYPSENPLQGRIPQNSAAPIVASNQVRTIAGMHPEMLKAHIRGGMPLNGLSAEAEELRRYENNQGSRSGRATNRMLYGDPPGTRRFAAPTPQNPPPEVPTTVFDQNGRPYTRNPGAHTVTDQRTGRECITNGSQIIKCL